MSLELTKSPIKLGTDYFYPQQKQWKREFALIYFCSLITFWNLLGQTFLGFEQAPAAPFVAVGSACFFQYLLEVLDAWAKKRPVRVINSPISCLAFYAPAIISGMALAMLLYPNDRLWPFVLGAALAITSKVLFRVPCGETTQHVFNPSNFAIAIVLFTFPWVGAAPPYHFTENIVGVWNWILPVIILCTGMFVHGFATGRLPLVLAWLCGFVIQAIIRASFTGSSWLVPLMPMTSTAFTIFTLYMVPDPATTPIHKGRQILFGFSVAFLYGLLQFNHCIYGLFVALTIISGCRGIGMLVSSQFKATKKITESQTPAEKQEKELVGASRR